MTTRTKIREEALVWLTRALLAAVVWATVWGLSYVLVPGVDQHSATAARYLARVESLLVMQDEDNRLQGTYVNVFQHIIERGFDSSRVVRGRDTLLINQWLEHGVSVKVPRERVEAWAIAAATDSVRFAVLEVLGLTPVNREFARRVQAELGFERQSWSLLATAMIPSSRRQALATFKRVQVDRLINQAALDTLYHYTNVAFHERELHFRALRDTLGVERKDWKMQSAIHVIVAYVGIVAIWAFAVFAATGRWETLPKFIRRRLEPSPESPDNPAHP